VPANLAQGNAQVTAITTAGTTTLNPGQQGMVQPGGQPLGQSGNLAASPGVFYGFDWTATGTSYAATAVDLVPPTLAQYNAGTGTQTFTLANGTLTAGQRQVAGLEGVGVRYRGALVVITAGTPGAVNALWE
jgi:hypothetical protein